MMTISEITKMQNLVSKIFNASKIIDDHNGRESDWDPKYLGIHKHGKEILPVWVSEHPQYFCINELYIDDDDKLHLSTISVGGVIDMRQKNFKQAVEKYNEEHSEYSPGCMKMHLSVLEKDGEETLLYIA